MAAYYVFQLLIYAISKFERQILLRNEYLAAENRILRRHIKGRLRLNDGERRILARIAKKLGKEALKDVANIYYVFFFIKIDSREIHIAGITSYPFAN